MANYYILFLATFIIFLAMIQEGLLVQSPPGTNLEYFNVKIKNSLYKYASLD